MTQLKWWMRIVGGFYLFLAVMSLPSIRANGFLNVFPELAGQQATLAFELLIDAWVMFGLELGVIGVMLILFSRAPFQAFSLVYTIIGLEIVRGIVDDIYMMMRGYSVGFYLGFITVHLLIIVTGLAFSRQRAARLKSVGIA
ncbi:MAG: BphX family protein [Anaerolineales bacterium]|nr:BphX family protein [Anaerolineales bacterium]